MNGTSNVLRVDDTSSRLVYSGSWAPSSLNNTEGDSVSIHTSTSAGSTVQFTFNGTFVAVYGVINGNSVNASFALDDEDPITTGVPHPPKSITQNWPFFSTNPPLKPGLHELVVTVNDGELNLDYVQYVTLPDHSDSPGDISQVQATPSSSASSSTSPIPKRGQLPLDTKIGIAVAASCFLVILFTAAVFFRRRSVQKVRHLRFDPEKPIDVIHQNDLKLPPVAARYSRRPSFRQLYRSHPSRSSKTVTSSAPTSITQSSAMFTSVIMLSPTLSMVSEESGDLGAV